MLSLAEDHRGKRALSVPPALLQVVRSLLADREHDPALIALALALPDVAYVAALAETIDVDGIVAARSFLVAALARALRVEFADAYGRHRVSAPYAPTTEQAGRRKLANACLSYLCATEDHEARAMAVAHFAAANNMTDAVAALAALKDHDSPERTALFDRFEAQWRDEPLVLDKWFALEAMSARGDALDRVKRLLVHPRFNARNPNRVRSLVGAFALRNFARFHDREGSGYAFAADEVLALDSTNPQLAAAIAGAFNLWKRFPEPRRGLMQAALQRIAIAPGLSPDVTEVVTRTLSD
jgi:aminopeptidase N